MSIVVAIIAVIAAMSASMGGSMIESARRVNTTNKLDAIENALMAFRLANNRLPCPTDPALTDIPANAATYGSETGAAGTCGGGSTASYTVPSPYTGTVIEGAVPVRALGLPDEFQVDGWGRKFAYAVWAPLTGTATAAGSPAGFINYGVSPSCGAIKVENAGHGYRTTTGAYALVSFGPDGHGGYLQNGTRRNAGVSNVDEDANAHYSAAGTDTGYLATYVQKEYGQYPGDSDSAHPFGDYVRFKERWQMQDAYDAFSPAGSACTLGFIIQGSTANENMGSAGIAVGDINGDGKPDLIIGAAGNWSPGVGGKVYVVFGQANSSSFTNPFPVSSLNGTNGFAITVPQCWGACSIAVGDINGDGYADIVVDNVNAIWGGNGKMYVIFGGPGTWPAGFSVAALNGSTGVNGTSGFVMDEPSPPGYGYAGGSSPMAIADINGDTY